MVEHNNSLKVYLTESNVYSFSRCSAESQLRSWQELKTKQNTDTKIIESVCSSSSCMYNSCTNQCEGTQAHSKRTDGSELSLHCLY